MSPKTLLAAAALSALAASPAAAQGGRYAAPDKPIPYAQLDAYLAASAKERATRDWWAEMPTATQTSAQADAGMDMGPAANAETGAAADASADIPDSSPTSPMTVNPSTNAPPEVMGAPDTPVPTTPPKE